MHYNRSSFPEKMSSDSENDEHDQLDQLAPLRPFGQYAAGRPILANVVAENQNEAEQEEAKRTLQEMFPLVCRNWIADSVRTYSVHAIVEYVMNNEADPRKVPKVVRKRPRLSMLNAVAKESSPVISTASSSLEDTPPHLKSNSDFVEKWRTMSLLERLERNETISALFENLRDCQPLKHNALSLFGYSAEIQLVNAYRMIKRSFINMMCSSGRAGTCTLRTVLIILELLSMGEEENLFLEPVFMNIVRRYSSPPARPYTQKITSNAKMIQAKSRENPFFHGGMAGRVWDSVQELINEKRGGLAVFCCEICFDEKVLVESVDCMEKDAGSAASSTRHRFCFTCISGHAKACCEEGRIVAGGLGIPCLQTDCDGHFTSNQLRASRVEKRVIHQLEKRLEQETLAAAGLPIERCKYCNFGVLMEIPPEVNKVFVCDHCTAEFCRLCKKDWEMHVGRRCDEMVTLEEEARKKLENELTAAVVHTCPRCQLSFEKEEGCNKMTCRCGLTMCYVCRETNITYTHFCGHFRDPSSGSRDCPENCPNKCLLWENTSKELQKNRRKILEEARQLGTLDGGIVDNLLL